MSAQAVKLGYFDWLRAASSQAVLLGHALNIFLPSIFMVERPDGLLEASRALPYIQNLGVVVFFALSGYLVTTAVLRKMASEQYGLAPFIVDRATRIFVPFVPAVLIVWLLDTLLLGSAPFNRFTDLPLDLWTALSNLLMLFNHPVLSIAEKVLGIDGIATSPIGSADPFWTIVLEWWLYCAFGVFALLLARGRRMGAGMTLLLLFALAPLVVSVSTGSGLVLAWPVGMLVAISERRLRLLPRQCFAGTLLLSAGVATAVWLRSAYDFYAPAFVVCFAYALIAYAVRSPEGHAESVAPRAVRLLSDYSYSLYLTHFSVLIYLQAYLPSGLGAFVAITVALIFANLVAFVFWWLFERHYLAVRWRLTEACRLPVSR